MLHHKGFEVALRYDTPWQRAHIHVKVKKNPIIILLFKVLGAYEGKKNKPKTILFLLKRLQYL